MNKFKTALAALTITAACADTDQDMIDRDVPSYEELDLNEVAESQNQPWSARQNFAPLRPLARPW